MKSLLLASVVATAAAFALAPAAQADDTIAAGVHAGTLGYGISVEKPLNRFFGVRVQNGIASYSSSGSSSTFTYTGTLHYSNYAVLVDFHPLGGAFRVTAGGVLSGNDHLAATGTPNGNGTYTINGDTYTAAQVGQLNGEVKFGGAAPYLGIGSSGRGPISFVSDVGIAFRSVNSTLAATGLAVGTPTFDSDLAAAQAKLQHDVSFLKTYPVVDIGLRIKI